jgi:hypothetical protein
MDIRILPTYIQISFTTYPRVALLHHFFKRAAAVDVHEKQRLL